MARGKFPYAVMDLLLSQEDQIYLSEINLQGGLKGARVSQKEFGQKVASLEQDFRRQWEES
jgi:ribosomal protein S6--L-glutamate ligase